MIILYKLRGVLKDMFCNNRVSARHKKGGLRLPFINPKGLSRFQFHRRSYTQRMADGVTHFRAVERIEVEIFYAFAA